MKVTCYLQIVPNYTRSGYLKGVSAKQLSQRHPSQVMDGARLVRLELDIPDNAFKATAVKAVIPIENLAPQVTATVS